MRDTNNNENNINNIIYLSLFNKYKEKVAGKNFGEKIKAISQCKQEEQYNQLNEEQQKQIYIELMALK